MLIVQVPRQFTIYKSTDLTSQIIGQNGYPIDQEMTFDFANLSWIDGGGLTVLENALSWLRFNNVQTWFKNHSRTSSSAICYLDDCGFFRNHTGEPIRSSAKCRGTTLACRKIEHTDCHQWLDYTFLPWISGSTGIQQGAFASLRTCISEVFNNTLDHSNFESGFVHVQFYPNRNEIRVTLSDFGRGIPNSIRECYGQLDDAEAILRATEEGVSAKSTPRNQGIGLSYLMSCIGRTKMSVAIISYAGRLTCFPTGNNLFTRHKSYLDSYYPGTLIEFSIDVRNFIGDEITEEEEYSW